MILRALLLIVAVALIVPHEPNLGLGRPSLAPETGRRVDACDSGSCTLDPAALAGVQAMVLASLIQVKADIAQAQRERDARN